QRRASMGISLRHSGHFLVVGSAGAGAFLIRDASEFTGVTTKKYTAAATNRNAMAALMKSPIANTLLLTVNLMAEKSGLPTNAAIKGVSRSFVKAATTVANAAPTTTPTAMSMTFPRRINCLKPFSMRHAPGQIWAQLYGGRVRQVKGTTQEDRPKTKLQRYWNAAGSGVEPFASS